PEFARAESAAIFYDLGVEQAPFSTLISYLIRVLCTLTNNVGRRGGNIFMETLLPPLKDASRTRGREPERALVSGIPAIEGDTLRISTRRGSVTLPARIDGKLLAGHVWMPNGFGMRAGVDGGDGTQRDGANQNELTDVADR